MVRARDLGGWQVQESASEKDYKIVTITLNGDNGEGGGVWGRINLRKRKRMRVRREQKGREKMTTMAIYG